MKYRLRDDSNISYFEFVQKLDLIPLIDVHINIDRCGMIITPSNELVNLINHNCVGGETDTFKNAMLRLFDMLEFNIDNYYLRIFYMNELDCIIQEVEEHFNQCEMNYNMSHQMPIRMELLSLLFEDFSNFFVRMDINTVNID